MPRRKKTPNATAKQLREFERSALELRRQISAARVEGVGLLTPGMMRRHIRNGQDIVLAYGRKGLTVRYTLDDLKKFRDQTLKRQKDFQTDKRGVPLLKLESASLAIDKQRAKTVKNATLYRVDRNLLYFRVTGNVQPYYQVRIRLEEWEKAVRGSYDSTAQAARIASMGNISIDCQCGRHQYWYRYLANIGGYDVTPPKEQDFPKIRNPGLTGACCKHVLKVLAVMKTAVIQKTLAKEIERQSDAVGFADRVANRYLGTKELEAVSKAKGITSKTPKEARAALKRFIRDAQEALEAKAAQTNDALKNLTPRQAKEVERRKAAKTKTQKPKTQTQKRLEDKIDVNSKEYELFVTGIRDVMKTVKAMPTVFNKDVMLTAMAQGKGLDLADMKEIMKREHIDE